MSEPDYAYRFEYADGSAFEIYEDGRAFIVLKDGRREQKFGKIDNRIPSLIGAAAKPRQDEIESLRLQLEGATSISTMLWDWFSERCDFTHEERREGLTADEFRMMLDEHETALLAQDKALASKSEGST